MQNAASEDFFFFLPPDHKNHNPQKRDEPFNCIYTALPRKVAVAVIQLDHLQVGSHSLPLALFQLIHAKSLSKKKKIKFCCKTSSSAQPGDSQWS